MKLIHDLYQETNGKIYVCAIECDCEGIWMWVEEGTSCGVCGDFPLELIRERDFINGMARL